MLKRITVFAAILMGPGLYQLNAEDSTIATSIISRSPFIPTGFDAAAQNMPVTSTTASAAGYEFRGVYQIGDRYWFLVSEPQSRDGTWIELGQNSDDVIARRYDPETKALTVVANNSELTLELATVNPNPSPIPVKGLIKTTTRTPVKAPTPVRRTIRPTTSGNSSPNAINSGVNKNATPPPAWLEKLRNEAALRRARSGEQADNNDNNNAARRRIITPNRPNADNEQSRNGEKSKRQKPTTQSR